MGFRYIDTKDAIDRDGLRMVVVGGVPSPWGEAAKGILHIKGIDWAAVRLVYDDDALKAWAGERSGPVAMYQDERPRASWTQILLLAERIQPAPSLIPTDPAERALMLGLCHELVGEQGLAWSRRLQGVHAGGGTGGFPKPVARYLGRKYGYSDAAGAAATQRVASLLTMFAGRLHAQRERGSQYYLGDTVTALDVYSATCCAMFAPLPEEVCEMDAHTRAMFEARDELTAAAFDDILCEHRDMMYREHLELPLSL